MDENEAKTIVFLIWNDKLARTSVLVIIILCLFLTVSLSFLSGVLVLAAYIGGFIVFNSIFKHRSEAPNFLSLLTGKQRGAPSVIQLKAWCAVCGSGKCKRHRPGPSSYSRQPWIGLEVPDEIDEAIEDFLNKTLKEFVYVWYNELSTDESFVLELRQSIRYAASVFLRRGLQVDLAHLIINKLVPAGLSHLDDYLGALRLSSRQRVPLDRAALQYLGPRLHPAARNRDNELSYLRQITTLLLPQLLPSSQLHCKNFSVLIRELLSGWILLPITDVLADPAIVNSLLLLLLDNYTLSQYPNRPPTRVEFLARFVSSVPVSHGSALRLDLSSVLKDQSLLYPFMQFLKGEGSVNILQFCLDVEEFNRKMLTPDLNKQDMENLYKEAWDLFSVYFSPESPDRIYFSQQVVSEMHAVLQEPAENIVKLRTTPPLFQAYEYAYSLLENTLCPLFHESDDYYTLLCGQRLPSGYNKSGSSSPMLQGSPAKGRATKKWTEGGAVARLSSRLHKIKGALRAQPVEGHAYDTDSTLDLGETEFAEDLQLSDTSESNRDLSAWRVSIPCVDVRRDATNKSCPLFNIDVQRIDVKSEEDPESYHWTVDRRYQDFYVLESKLTEFHGEFPDTQLPPKRILSGPRGIEFMESKRQVFEEFLQRLLQKPNLRGSDLLYSFLRSPGEFVPPGPGGIAGAMPEGLGRMIRRSVPLRLRKERGQHLDTFLNAFVASTEGSKTKPSKYEWRDLSVEAPRRVRSLTKTVFRNNFGIESNQPLFALSTSRSPSSCSMPVQGVFDCLLYLAVRVFGAPQTVVRVAMAVRVVAHNTVNALCSFYLDRKLRKLLIAPRLAHLIKLLQGAVFQPKTGSPSPAELELRAARALAQLQTLVPNYIARWAGPAYQAGLLTLFSALQSPALNKQLVYTLLDVLAAELYPDLATGEISPQ
ncbi:sorting nexin-14-like isoform X2 [Periplaneta americana]|uniref:sorting nexin-14-like isoform X2 n=1 Tax=Periplaneta americana TaxID=6978 RepID=UPI0037E75D8E